jgi:branched-chain amino acid transport system substrate-binding protein
MDPFRHPRRVLRAVAAAALTVAVTLAGSGAGHTAAVAAEPPFEINAVLSLTGTNALLGTEVREVLQTAEDDVNKSGGIRGRPIRFVVADDQTNTQVSVQLVNALIARNVPVILGPGITASCKAVMPLVLAHGPVTICFTPGVAMVPGSYVFSSTVSTQDTVSVGVRYLRSRGVTRIGFIAATDASGQEVEDRINAALALPENRGMQIVDREHFNPTDISVTAQMARIEAAKAQAVWCAATGTPFGTVVHGMRDTGLDLPVYTNNSNMTYDQMTQYAPFLPREVMFSGMIGSMQGNVPNGPVRDAQSFFFSTLKNHGLRVTSGHNLSWDSTMMLVDAFRHLGFNATADQLHAYMESLHGWSGVNGTYDFRDGSQRGVTERSIVVYHWDPAKADFAAISRPGGEAK